MMIQKCQLKRTMQTHVTLGTIIKVDSGDISSFSDSSSPPDIGAECISTNDIKKRMKVYSRLPSQFDPNLGLLPYLPPLLASYNPKMNQAWNIAPYFLNILPQSSGCDLSDSVLLMGGLNPFKPDDFVLSSSIFEFHISSQTWRYYGSMLEPRCYHATCSVGHFLYVTGGYSALQRKEGEMLAVPSTDRLDIKTTLWKRCVDMKVARASHAMAALRKSLFVFGGRNSLGRIIASVEMYDTENDFWTEITRLPRPAMGLSATCVNNQVWILGGITEDKEKAVISDVYTFKPSNKSWCVQKPLPGPHAFASCVSSGYTIWVVGGSHYSEEALVSCPCIWRTKFKTGQAKWKMAAALTLPTHSSCTILRGKELYIFGGIRSDERRATKEVEIFNTETGALRKGVNLPAPIAGSSAIFLEGETSLTKTKKMVKVVHGNEFTPKRFLDQATRTADITNQRNEDFEEQSSLSYSDALDSDTSKSIQEKSPDIHASAVHDANQHGEVTTKAHLYVNYDCSYDSEKQTDAKTHLRRRTLQRSSSTEKSSDNHAPTAESDRRHFQKEQKYAKDHEYSKHSSDFSRSLYVTTLKFPVDGKEFDRKYRQKDFQSMKTEMILENRRWKPIEICFSDSNSGSNSESNNFKLYHPPPKWKRQ